MENKKYTHMLVCPECHKLSHTYEQDISYLRKFDINTHEIINENDDVIKESFGSCLCSYCSYELHTEENKIAVPKESSKALEGKCIPRECFINSFVRDYLDVRYIKEEYLDVIEEKIPNVKLRHIVQVLKRSLILQILMQD